MSLLVKDWSRWEGWDLLSLPCCQGISSKGRYRLWQNFSPVAKLKSIWILLSISAYYDHEIWQMNVKTTFLNGELKVDCIWHNPRDSHPSLIIIKFKSCNDPFMDWNKVPKVGTFTLTKQLKFFILLDVRKNLVCTKSLVGV